jgi:hypothetical protein
MQRNARFRCSQILAATESHKRSLNERLRRGGSKRRLGLETPNYLVLGIRESVLEETTLTLYQRPGLGIPTPSVRMPSQPGADALNFACEGTQDPAPPRLGQGATTMRIATALAAGLLFATGASSACAGDTDAALTRYIEVLNSHMPPHPEDGAAIAQFFAAFFNSFDEQWVDYRHVERRRVVSGNDAVWEGTGQGTWKTTGKPVEFPMIMSLVFNDAGEIIASQVYLDPGRVRAQAQ